MDRRQQLLGAITLGVIVAAAAGCGDSVAYKSYTQDTESPPAPVASATPAVEAPTNTAESAAPAETAAVSAPDASPAVVSAEAAPAATPVVEEPAVPGELPAAEVTAARPETVASAPEDAGVTPASASEADGTLIAAVGSAAAIAAVKLEPRETKLLIPEKSFQREGGALRVSYDDLDLLKVLNMEPVTAAAPDQFPQWLKDLEGERIRLRGYMRPGELAEELPFFVLARDTQACCFGPNTKAYDIIPVMMREGVTTDYIHLRPFDIVGVLHINVEMDLDDPNKVEFLYYIDDAVLVQK